MRTSLFTMMAITLVVGLRVIGAAGRVVGVIASVNPRAPLTLQLASKGAEAATVRTDEHTAFLKWVTHKPWQQSAATDAGALVEGRCVEVELSSSNVAKTVYVSDEPAGSIFDPCKAHR